jgi:FixJ family two-component response regulator
MTKSGSNDKRNINLLVVDDEKPFLKMTVDWLDSINGFEFEKYTNPETAINELDEGLNGEIEVVLTDYDMPGLNGLELTEEIHDIDPDLPVILHTGKGSEEIAIESLRRGVTDYMQKNSTKEHFELLANRIENAAWEYRSTSKLSDLEPVGKHILGSKNPVIIWDQNYETVFSNPAMSEFCGHEGEDMRDTPLDKLENMNWIEEYLEMRDYVDHGIEVDVSGELYHGNFVVSSLDSGGYGEDESQDSEYTLGVFHLAEE